MMIVPASTSCPSPRLTPSRLPALSRPFLLDEPAFLCAMASYVSLLGVVRLRAAAAFAALGFAGAAFGLADAARGFGPAGLACAELFAAAVFGFGAFAVAEGAARFAGAAARF